MVAGPGTYPLPGNHCRDSESVSKKILGSRRVMPLQLTVFFIIIYVLESLTVITQSNLIFAVLSRDAVIDGLDSHLPGHLLLLSTVGVGPEQFLLLYFNSNYVFWYLSITWEFTSTLMG